MKTRFLCGGISWECFVDVDLSEEEINVLKEYAENHPMEEHLSYFTPTSEIYNKVSLALEEQCNDLEGDYLIWLPVNIRNKK